MDTRAIPYSWGDVADTLRSEDAANIPLGLIKADVYWDSLTLVSDDAVTQRDLEAWLSEVFPLRYRDGHLHMDGPEFSSELPVYFERYDEEIHGAVPVTMAQQYVAASTEIWFRSKKLEEVPEQVQFPTFAFHSVKGGVGRTTSAISFALTLASEGRKPLLVDADFEAPGISYLFLSDARQCHASLEDLLVLSHADDDAAAERTISFLSSKLQNQSHEGITFLPCMRNLDMLTAFAIRPEQLQRSHSERPFFVINLLKRLALKAGCDTLVIDLRAGFTDLAAMVLGAPGVSAVFVTTPSGQSIVSTREMMSFIAAQTRKDPSWRGRPAVVVNNVIPQVRRSRDFQNTLSLLEDSVREFIAESETGGAVGSIIDLSTDEVTGPAIATLDHSPSLTAAASGLSDFIDDLKGQPCFDQLSTALRDWSSEQLDVEPSLNNIAPANPAIVIDQEQKRRSLHEFAKQRIFAESSEETSDQFLVVRALRELGERFRTEMPNATCIGMKGAGKTFTFRLLAGMRTWSDFQSKVSPVSQVKTSEALILPVLPASNLQILGSINASREAAANVIGGQEPITFTALREQIDEAAKKFDTESDWSKFWLDAIAWSCGIGVGHEGAGSKLVDSLIKSGQRIVSLFDGVEESFQSFRQDARQQAAIRGLVSAMPLRLLELPGRPIGQINFIRSDLVATAFTNNSRQFVDRNRAFALTWYDRDILELAAWLADQAGVAKTWDHSFQDEDNTTIEDRLTPLWGRKLGKADNLSKDGRTREPRSSEWVIAALSDLRGRLTARDLVGFISNSAKMSLSDENPSFQDRLLVPKAMKNAITPVGQQKMAAMGEENPELKAVLDKLKSAPQFAVPIELTDFKKKIGVVADGDLEILKENGVILVEGDLVEMPEIFRTGLGNVVRNTGGRKSIIGLMAKAKQARNSDLVL